MPKIKSYAPGWLNEPAPGHKLFAMSGDDAGLPAPVAFAKRSSRVGPRRTIARRGKEVFVASGKHIRWGDLLYLKGAWDAKQTRVGRAGMFSKRESSLDIYEDGPDASPLAAAGAGEGYRIIKVPVADDIRQLVMSPQQDLLAVLTTHTVHICLLPDPSHLSSRDSATPFKPRFWTLGPTTHVTSRSAVAAAVWHPLGVNGTCLVTVTEDAIVRVWELSLTDRWSFDAPSLAIDLRRLADGTSLDQDFSVSTSATNKGFSPDSFDMEVAAACFPARGSGSWSSMTLWVAMVGGDVYALCPLLPQKWAPPSALIPALSVAIVERVAAIEDDPAVPPEAKLLAQQQLEWMSDIDNQEPKTVEGSLPGEPPAQVYARPSKPGTVPRLQGPFEFNFNPNDEQDDEVEIRDVFVIGEKMSTANLMTGEEDEDEEFDLGEEEREGLSLSVICLLSTSGQVKICLDVEGVEAQWLPPWSKAKTRRFTPSEPPALLTFQTFDTLKPAELVAGSWPMFSEDVTSRYSFFVTHPAGITYVSLAPWVFRLESEFQGDSEAGQEFRIDLLVKDQGSERERIYLQQPGQNVLGAATAFRDPDLGYFVLSATHNDPIAVFFDTPEDDDVPYAARPASPSPLPEVAPEAPHYESQPIVAWEPRPLFHPSEVLYRDLSLPKWIERVRTGKRRHLLGQVVRLSVATLETFNEGHRIVSSEVYELNNAVAELFRKCDALLVELREQVIKANDARRRIDAITGDDDCDDVAKNGFHNNKNYSKSFPEKANKQQQHQQPQSTNTRVQSRVRDAQRRQEGLNKRVEAIRRRLGGVTTRELSDKEKAWADELHALAANIGEEQASREAAGSAKKGQQQQQQQQRVLTTPSKAHVAATREAWKRVEEVKSLEAALSAQVEQVQKSAKRGSSSPAASNGRGDSRGRDSVNVDGGLGKDEAVATPAAGTASPSFKVPSEIRKAKLAQVMGLLERETALVDAAKARLERLSMA